MIFKGFDFIQTGYVVAKNGNVSANAGCERMPEARARARRSCGAPAIHPSGECALCCSSLGVHNLRALSEDDQLASTEFDIFANLPIRFFFLRTPHCADNCPNSD